MNNTDDWFGYQINTSRIFRGTKHVFINDGTGLGKTRSALACLANSYIEGPNIIVCPKVAIEAWKSEIETVFPDADYKFFLIADINERARRRMKDMEAKGEIITLEELIGELAERDRKDSTREHSPLKKAEDAVELTPQVYV